MTTETEQPESFTYFDLDASQIPTRPRNIGPGRPSHNPHTETLKAIAGTDGVKAFLVQLTGEGDTPEKEVKQTVDRHTRWLRQGAREHNRSATVWHDVVEDENGNRYVRIGFKDIPYVARPRARKSGNAAPSDAQEGNSENANS